ncbi:MAG: DUF935 domain-containing protein [Methylotetracoccus sp.]
MLLDHRGQPIRPADLQEPQTSKVASLKREFARHPARGLTPAKLASVLERAEQGDIVAQHELFLDIEEKDAHIYAEMHKRKMAVAGLDWTIEPPRNASAAEESQAALLEETVRDIPDIEDVIFDLADGIGHGFACLEYEWERAPDWRPRAINHRPQSWFTLDLETHSELRLRGASQPEPLQPFGWIVHVHRAKSGYIARSGLFRVLAWPFLFKNYSVRDLAEFLEIYGLPARIGKYPPGSDDKAKATLLRALIDIGHNAAGIIPEGMAMEFLAAASGQADPYKLMIDWCESSASKAILGGTLTAQPGEVGSRSLGEVHNEVRVEIRNHDARQIAASLTRHLIYPLCALNGQAVDPRRCPRFVFDTGEPEDLKLYAESLPKLVDYGARIPVRWMQEKLRIPEPEGAEPIMESKTAPAINPLDPNTPQPPPKPKQEPQPAAARAALPHDHECPACAAAASAGIDTPDALDGLRELALDGWEPQTRPVTHPLVQALHDAIANGETLEQFRARVEQLLAEMDPAALAEMLARASFMARAAGDVNVDIGGA